jgi:hypothetical protein
MRDIIAALRRAKAHKAAGADNVPAEAYTMPVLRHCDSSQHAAECHVDEQQCSCAVLTFVHRLFQLIWRAEHMPKQWTHSLIMPLLKAGDARDPLNWRPISLIPSIAKLFSSVLCQRLDEWCEAGNRISSSQFGFRQRQSICGPLFVFSELLEHHVIERRRPVYACFIDVRKAYDLVWRDGLLARLWHVGVRGKMLRVIRAMYTSTTAAVLVNNFTTEPVELHHGVKQGDNLSPLLFNIFFDGLSEALSKVRTPAVPAVQLGDMQIRHLMYADDLLLLADHPASLQTLLSLTAEYFNQWRLTLNYDKTRVVVFDRQPASRQLDAPLQFEFNALPVQIAESYTYLGVLFTQKLDFKQHKLNRITRAQQRVQQLNWMRRKGHLQHIIHSLETHELLVMTAVESCGHVCGYGRQPWPDLVKLQHQTARQLLEAIRTSSHLALQGELGWLDTGSRSNRAHLLYFGRLLASSKTNLARQVLSQRLSMAAQQPQACIKSWSSHVKRLLTMYGFKTGGQLTPAFDADKWPDRVRSAVDQAAESQWRRGCEQLAKLTTYCLVKRQLTLEPYLCTTLHSKAAVQLTRLRCGSNTLAVDQLRGSCPRHERLCRNCVNSASVEDERHVLLHCARFSQQREWFMSSTNSLCSSGLVNLQAEDESTLLRYVMGDILGTLRMSHKRSKEQMSLILRFVSTVMAKHQALDEFWAVPRIRVGWQFDGSTDGLSVSLTVGSDCGDAEVVCV